MPAPEPALGGRIRQAGPADLDALAAFEVEIARISFPDDPIDDPAVQRRKLSRAMAGDPTGMLVAEDGAGRVVGWLWVTMNRNFTTGAPYANFRSLAVHPDAVGGGVAEALLRAGLAHAREQGAGEVVGRVHVSNVPMRLVYHAFGFRAQHLTMRLPLIQ